MPLIRPIPINPGNVLMMSTQGIVSSEAVFHSCQDGYVLDSRDSVWTHQSHATFKKPSQNIRIPEMLTLSYRAVCIDCHGQRAIWRYMYFYPPSQKKEFASNKDMGPKDFFEMACNKKEMTIGLRPQ